MARRLNAAGAVVGHKMSMLPDLERSRSMEIDALVTAVRELGRLVDVATPTIDAALALVQERPASWTTSATKPAVLLR
jgi:2-dehydropantoate 2-reductase